MAELTVDDNEVKIKIDKSADEIEDAINKGLKDSCALLLNAAIKNAPVQSGQLRGSLTMDVDEEAHTGSVGTNLDYAPYVEIGTGIYSSKGSGRQTPWTYKDARGNFHRTEGNQPQPFLKPALEQVKSQIVEVIGDAIRSSI